MLHYTVSGVNTLKFNFHGFECVRLMRQLSPTTRLIDQYTGALIGEILV